MKMPARIYWLRKELDLYQHHFKTVDRIEVRELPRGAFWAVCGQWRRYGHQSVITIAPRIMKRSDREVLWVLAHEAGHNYKHSLEMRLGPNYRQNARFQMMKDFRNQFQGLKSALLWSEFGIEPGVRNESPEEYFCHLFTAAVGGNGVGNQRRLKEYCDANFYNGALAEFVGADLKIGRKQWTRQN